MTPGLLMSSVVTAHENLSWDLNLVIWCIESLIETMSDDKIFISVKKIYINMINTHFILLKINILNSIIVSFFSLLLIFFLVTLSFILSLSFSDYFSHSFSFVQQLLICLSSIIFPPAFLHLPFLLTENKLLLPDLMFEKSLVK
jgi:hypothetical protein